MFAAAQVFGRPPGACIQGTDRRHVPGPLCPSLPCAFLHMKFNNENGGCEAVLVGVTSYAILETPDGAQSCQSRVDPSMLNELFSSWAGRLRPCSVGRIAIFRGVAGSSLAG